MRYLCRCLRCLHTWLSSVERPARCARCTARNWWKPKREPAAGVEASPKKAQFDISELKVGEKKVIEWPEIFDERPKVNRYVTAWARRHNWVVATFGEARGLLVIRQA